MSQNVMPFLYVRGVTRYLVAQHGKAVELSGAPATLSCCSYRARVSRQSPMVAKVASLA